MYQQHVFKKFNHSAVPEIVGALDIPADQISQLQALTYDLPVLQKLIELNHLEAAVHYLACGLPKREAIWWGLLCSQEAEQTSSDPTAQKALVVVEEWVKNPSDEKRHEAGKLGEALEYYTPSSWIATAVFWSGGSIAKDEKPLVEPTHMMCGEAASNAIVLAADKTSKPAQEVIQGFIKRGLHIAMGGNGKFIA